MKKWLVVALPIAVVGFILSPKLFLMPVGSPEPTSYQLPFFIILGIFESLAMGFGVAFILFGYKLVKKAGRNSRFVAWSLYLSTSWFLLNWWVHDGLHKTNGMNLQGLLYIEYAFHATMMIMAGLSAYAFFRVFSKNN